MNLKILSWNVRGLNEKEKRLKVRNFFILGGLISFVCKRQNWNGLQEDLLELSLHRLVIFGFKGCFWWNSAHVG